MISSISCHTLILDAICGPPGWLDGFLKYDAVPQEVESLLHFLDMAVAASWPDRLGVKLSLFFCKSTHGLTQEGAHHRAGCYTNQKEMSDENRLYFWM